ncbi:MAG: DUF4340 domain-containing protein [Chloroflexota bacterium]|nr:DUF4340 domain-containing protein [Chloroflexota bacterium]
MKWRNTILLVALFALLFGYVWFVERPKTSEQLATPTTPSPVVFKLDAASVKSIEVRDLQLSRQVKVTRAASGWQVEQPIAKPADSSRIDQELSQLATLNATRVLTDVTDLAPFGLVTPTLEARLVLSDTTPYAITVGNKTPDQSSYYVTYSGDKKVFIVNSSAIDELLAWLNEPPYEPTPTPTFTPTPPVTPTAAATETITTTATPGAAPPGNAPTLVPVTDTPKP